MHTGFDPTRRCGPRRHARAPRAARARAASGRRIVAWLVLPGALVAVAAASSSTSANASPRTPAAVVSDTTQWTPPDPERTTERRDERSAMVRRQITSRRGGRIPVTDLRVLDAMRTVPRHAFVPDRYRRSAYDDTPLPIGHGQTISQPYMVAIMTELLGVDSTSRVLEVGTGSGYQAAILAHLTPHVYTVEIVEPLATRARETLSNLGYRHVHSRYGDGYNGWPEVAPFDAIIVTCAAGHVPPPLWKQLVPGGRMVIPIGTPASVQRLVVVQKTPDGRRESRTIMGVRFVPMTGRAESP